MNAIVTVIGKDKVGIIAAVCIKLAEMNVNVLDIHYCFLRGCFVLEYSVTDIRVSYTPRRSLRHVLLVPKEML